jgi:hypothetical protein
MRLSVEPGDPGYDHAGYTGLWMHATVTLDGEILTNCITADEEKGTALCYLLVDGKPQHDGVGGLRRVELHGKVKIELPEEFKRYYA